MRTSSESSQAFSTSSGFRRPRRFASARSSATRRSTRRPKRDWQGWWVKQAEELHWFKRWDKVLDDSEPAVLQVVRRRAAERLLQLSRPPCRGGPGRPGRVQLARRGGRGAQAHLRRPPRRRRAVRQRAEGPRDQEGRRRRDLPADDPRGGRRDARLRAHRRAAQRRLRRLLAGGGPRADGVLRGQGADHRRWRRTQGHDRTDQAGQSILW